MIKIYLDWNCITHSKEQEKLYYVSEIVDKYKQYIICPYTTTHLRDVIVSREKHKDDFDKDLIQLTKIAENHLLYWNGKQILPKSAFPKECVEKEGNVLNFIQTIEWIKPDIYVFLKQYVQNLLPEDIRHSIQKENDPTKVFPRIDDYIQHTLKCTDLQHRMTNNQLKELIDVETRFKTMCLGLDIFGYKSEEKNKSFANIDADAEHIFMAAHCDYLVSADKRMRAKAQALYSKFQFQTIVIKPEDLENVVQQALSTAFSIDYIHSCIDTYGHPISEDSAGIHYRLLPIPLFTLFSYCITGSAIKQPLGDKTAFFFYGFKVPYLFDKEIETFLNKIIQHMPMEYVNDFIVRYANPIMRHERISAPYRILFQDQPMEFILHMDPLHEIPIPMLQIVFTG